MITETVLKCMQFVHHLAIFLLLCRRGCWQTGWKIHHDICGSVSQALSKPPPLWLWWTARRGNFMTLIAHKAVMQIYYHVVVILHVLSCLKLNMFKTMHISQKIAGVSTITENGRMQRPFKKCVFNEICLTCCWAAVSWECVPANLHTCHFVTQSPSELSNHSSLVIIHIFDLYHHRLIWVFHLLYFSCTLSFYLALFQLLHCQYQCFRWEFRSQCCMLSVWSAFLSLSSHSLSLFLFSPLAILMPVWCLCISVCLPAFLDSLVHKI